MMSLACSHRSSSNNSSSSANQPGNVLHERPKLAASIWMSNSSDFPRRGRGQQREEGLTICKLASGWHALDLGT